jgi:hypothetical protein
MCISSLQAAAPTFASTHHTYSTCAIFRFKRDSDDSFHNVKLGWTSECRLNIGSESQEADEDSGAENENGSWTSIAKKY